MGQRSVARSARASSRYRPAPVAKFADQHVDRGYDAAFARDKFFVNQKRLSIGAKYYIFDEAQQPILFVERPAHLFRGCLAILGAVVVFVVFGGAASVLAAVVDQEAPGTLAGGIVALVGVVLAIVLTLVVAVALSPKRHITIYADDTKTAPLLKVYQNRKFYLIRATYTVEDPQSGLMGHLMKNYLYNVFRKRWYVLAPDGTTVRFVAKEDSLILSLLRRLLGVFFGLLRTNYVILEPGNERIIGEFNRKFTLFDRYVLDMSADRDHALDRRLALALGVILDTGERR